MATAPASASASSRTSSAAASTCSIWWTNNGTYGLTKGQFSATNDRGSTSKKGVPNLYEPIDMISMALQIGASFVARSFSGDKGQLVPLIKAGLLHEGFAFIDVISPCVAFNNHNGSTKSYDYIRAHSGSVVDADLIAPHDEITVDYDPGASEDVEMPDGSTLRLRKLAHDYNPPRPRSSPALCPAGAGRRRVRHGPALRGPHRQRLPRNPRHHRNPAERLGRSGTLPWQCGIGRGQRFVPVGTLWLRCVGTPYPPPKKARTLFSTPPQGGSDMRRAAFL